MALKHRPPSRVRYAQRHPSVGVHLDRATYDRVTALRDRSGLSFAHLFQRALGEVELQVDSAVEAGRRSGRKGGLAVGRRKGRSEGYDEAVAKFRLTSRCALCDRDMVIFAGSPMGEAAAAWFQEERWQHDHCPPLS
jgi:hypothetical protein